MVLIPGSARARSSPLSFTTMPIISGGPLMCPSAPASPRITSSLSAICGTCLGETKLTASMCRNPASISSRRYLNCVSVGIWFGNPCHASRGHSINFMTAPVIGNPRPPLPSRSRLEHTCAELSYLRVERGGLEGPDECLARLCWVNDRVHPQARGRVTRIGLMLVSGAYGFVQCFLLFIAEFLSLALELLHLDLDQRASRRIAAHHRVRRRGPCEQEPRVIRLAAHGVMSGPKAPAADHRDFRHHAVGHGIHHFGAGADDPAPFRLFPHHESIHVVQKHERHQILVAVQDESRSLLRRLRV